MILWIGNQHWFIKKVAAHHTGLYVGDSFRAGACWGGSQTVYLSEELDRRTASSTIMHELTHAYIASTQAYSEDNWTEEMVCDLIGCFGDILVYQARQVLNEFFPEVEEANIDG